MAERQRLSDDSFIRAQMFADRRSSMRRYADLVVGPGRSYWKLLQYEIITGLFGGLPGALGLALRRLFYPLLFRRVGRAPVFGRHLVIRNAHRISLGDQVVIDDGCVLDGRGAGEEGVRIGDRVIIGRLSMIQAKVGPIAIGDDCDIGAMSVVHSQGGTYLGREVVLGGGCKISGGAFDVHAEEKDGGPLAAREQARVTSGPIRIGDRCLFGMGAMVLDGVEVGEGTIVGAGSILVRSVPARAVVAGSPARVLRMREPATTPPEEGEANIGRERP